MGENAVAFTKAGNAKLNKMRAGINDAEQVFKMHSPALTIMPAALTAC
jgi:hypothetical protein